MVKKNKKYKKRLWLICTFISLLLFIFAGLSVIKFLASGPPAQPDGNRAAANGRGRGLTGSKELIITHMGHACRLTLDHLPEELKSQNVNTISEEKLLQLLPDRWELVFFGEDKLYINFAGLLCPYCRDLKYIGLYKDKIAIFSGLPPNGVLVELTDFDVKDIYRDELSKGVPFNTEEEKERILESYTT